MTVDQWIELAKLLVLAVSTVASAVAAYHAKQAHSLVNSKSEAKDATIAVQKTTIDQLADALLSTPPPPPAP